MLRPKNVNTPHMTKRTMSAIGKFSVVNSYDNHGHKIDFTFALERYFVGRLVHVVEDGALEYIEQDVGNRASHEPVGGEDHGVGADNGGCEHA